MATERLLYIDRLKGFAILCVVMGHFVFFTLKQTDIIAEIIGSFQMPLFIFMSGYVISSSPSLKKCCKKVVSFMLPMLIVGGIYVWFSSSTIEAWILTPFKYGYWYFYVLSVFYFLLCVVGKVGGGNILKVVSSILLFVLLCAINHFVPQKWNDIFSIWMLKLYWPFFILAFFVRQINLLPLLLQKNYIYTFSIIGYVVGFVFYTNNHPHLFHLNALLFIVAILYLFMATEEKNNAATKVLSYFGRHTLEIYIFHFFIIHLTSLEVLGNWFVSTGNIFLEVSLGIVYSFVVSYICIMIGKVLHMSNIIDKVMFGKIINKWK